MKKTRIYGRTVRTWEAENANGIPITYQWEIAYKDYDEDGKVVGTGTEDFSRDRLATETRMAYAYGWNGTRRNAGGHKWWELLTGIRYRRGEAAAVRHLLYKWYDDVKEVELR
jgi:hypothetical protein